MTKAVRWVIDHPRRIWTSIIAVVVFGAASYLVLLPKDGLPAVDFPVAIASGAYLVDDPERVDRDVAQPLAALLASDPLVHEVQSYSRSSSFTVIARLDPDAAPGAGKAAIDRAVEAAQLPEQAQVVAESRSAAKLLNEFDLIVAITGPDGVMASELEAVAAELSGELYHQDIERTAVVDLIRRGENPLTGQQVELETAFMTRQTKDGFRPSVAVGVVASPNVDALGIRTAVDSALRDAPALPDGFSAAVGLDFATTVQQQVGSLQQNVLTGLLAVMTVMFVMISWRAAVLTSAFIITVLAGCAVVFWFAGIGLNTLSLFGLILALGLFVDDAIVITESIDAEPADPAAVIPSGAHERVVRAVTKVGAATISGTLTTVLVFLPMLTIDGVLGDFIRILPITVSIALIVSLAFSLAFIPSVAASGLLAKRRTPSRLETASRSALARFVSSPGNSGRRRGAAMTLASVLLSAVGFFVFAPSLGFDIFPPAKDANQLDIEISFSSGTTLDEAKAITNEANEATSSELGDLMIDGYTFLGDTRRATTRVTLPHMGDRPTVHELVARLNGSLGGQFETHRIRFTPEGAGPPDVLFPFLVQVYSEDPAAAVALASEVELALRGAELTLPSGEQARVVETNTGLQFVVARWDGERLVEVRARFDNDQTSATTQAAQAFLETRFGPIEQLGGAGSAARLGYDFGLETENQSSFASLPTAFGIATVLILALLVIQFRSASQWLLVFLAVPFSAFGAFGLLALTGNELSFFVMLGALGLIGIAVNNTILLTDSANQHRNDGADARVAIQRAIEERFRPLIVTTATTTASLLPLALVDPFWQPLAITIIGGLLSSTFFVLLAFPFYYRALEAARDAVSGRRARLT